MTGQLDYIVRPFEPRDAAAFAGLNRQWIDALFEIEEKDRFQLEHPQTAILGKGGYIAIAEANGWVVGTGAVMPAALAPKDGKSWFEIVKMSTDISAQHMGIGSRILDQLIDYAKDHMADALWLETNDRLEAATHLYRKKGFQDLVGDAVWETPYERCNMQMVMEL
ncbi:GNAT family N-acetyltransferase [Altererythrobacter lutimaris]|uniref:GNAT family N-acetyltransferase n=1 Tax=Altererythrobacter lutimaris TaxID=2743979 RepID=A0A850H4C3_9SPHN|nr:GNAT family N-acetyltransferase [Altererythrobacter lutimaris]NVE94044.1 GNAT family N-acetyltransferase [Altererythrobacter lutimaris]